MKKKQKEIGSEDIQELSQRVVELLAAAAVNLVTEGEKGNSPISVAPDQPYDFPIVRKGRIPFGQRMSHEGLVENEIEMFLIRRIQELAEQGHSTEKIARQLNQEDHVSKRAGKWSRTAVWRILKRLKEKSVTK